MERWAAVALALVVGALGSGCLGVPERDQDAERVALAPRETLGLPLRTSRPYWLLRSQPGWVGSHEVHLGGAPEDRWTAVIAVARFRDSERATRAYARLTPDYIYLLLRQRMASVPYPFVYPVPLPGDEVAVMVYDVPLPPEAGEDIRIVGQLTTLRAGAVVLLVESIGIPPPWLVRALTDLTEAADRVTQSTK